MPDKKPDALEQLQQRQMALSRWDNEGGAGLGGPQKGAASGENEYRGSRTDRCRAGTPSYSCDRAGKPGDLDAGGRN